MATRWITRHGKKQSGFRYRDAQLRWLKDVKQLERIDALRIPPAWRNVHIAVNERAAIQAWGIDAKGRKQYRYHQRAVERGQNRKYYRVRDLAHDLPQIRTAVGKDFRRKELCRERVAAAVVRLISEGFFRIGSERYAKENNTFGIATLLKQHVRVDGDCIIFEYVGKRSIRHRQVVVDATLARFIHRLKENPGVRLFRYRDAEQRWCDLTARDVNDYLHRVLGVPYTAKDFRTWGGTLRVATVLADITDPGAEMTERQRKRNVVLAIRLVAAELGNTPAVCRKSYVHPMVIAKYLDDGETIARRLARAPHRRSPYDHHPEERALLSFLDRHFPERRRRARQEELVAA